MAGFANTATKAVSTAATAATLLTGASIDRAMAGDCIQGATPTTTPVPATMVLNYTNCIPHDSQLLAHATDLVNDGRYGGRECLAGYYYALSSGGGMGVAYTQPMIVVKTPDDVPVAALGVRMMLMMNVNNLVTPDPSLENRWYQASVGKTNELISAGMIPDDYAKTGPMRADTHPNVSFTLVRDGLLDGYYVYSMAFYFPKPAPLPKGTAVRVIAGPYESQVTSDRGVQGAIEVKGASADTQANLIINSDGLQRRTVDIGMRDQGKLGLELIVVPWTPETPRLTLSTTPYGDRVLTSSPIEATKFEVKKSSDLVNWESTGVEFSPTNTSYNFGQMAGSEKMFFKLEMKNPQ